MTRMSKFALLAAASMMAVSAHGGSAFAGGQVVMPEPEVYVPEPAPSRVWHGLYGGLSASAISGRITNNDAGPTPDLEDDNGLGVFAGYNFQRGNFVFGGELSYIDFDTPYVGFPNSFQQNALELRARAGYARNNALFYGLIGAARSDLNDLGTEISQSGVSYGLGAQVMFRGGLFGGIELVRRDVSGSIPAGGNIDSQIDTLTARIGFQF